MTKNSAVILFFGQISGLPCTLGSEFRAELVTTPVPGPHPLVSDLVSQAGVKEPIFLKLPDNCAGADPGHTN